MTNQVTNHKSRTAKLLFLIILLIILAGGAIFSQRTIFAAEDSEKKYLLEYADYDDVDDLVEDYHDALNKEMNERIKKLVEAEADELKEMEKIPEEERDEQGNIIKERDPKECPQNATSTYCVSWLFLDEYYAFRGRMIELRNELYDKVQVEAMKKYKEDGVSGYDEVMESVRELDAKIDRELGYAQKTIELAFAAYNELHMAYPLHQKFNEFIDVLDDFRDELADIRDEVELFPFTFFNVQTTQCK